MDQKIQALSTNKTWDIFDLPPGKSPIGCKWVYKIKFKVDGSVERYKARLVAKGSHNKKILTTMTLSLTNLYTFICMHSPNKFASIHLTNLQI